MDDTQIKAKVLEISGCHMELRDALEMWQLERETIAQLFDENQALGILNRRLARYIDTAKQLVDAVEKDAQMFITITTRGKIERFRELYEMLEKHIEFGKEIVHNLKAESEGQ